MKFKTFAGLVIIVLIVGFFFITRSCVNNHSDSSVKTSHVMEDRPMPPVTVQSQNTTEGLRSKLNQWLNANSNRQGKNKWVDILPNESFRATAIRFPETDAKKWSNDSSQWSQIRLDLNRDGIDDEKWLLKNGHTYKREALDANGRVTFTEYFP